MTRQADVDFRLGGHGVAFPASFEGSMTQNTFGIGTQQGASWGVSRGGKTGKRALRGSAAACENPGGKIP